jgi:hypothetical protein
VIPHRIEVAPAHVQRDPVLGAHALDDRVQVAVMAVVDGREEVMLHLKEGRGKERGGGREERWEEVERERVEREKIGGTGGSGRLHVKVKGVRACLTRQSLLSR